MIRRHDSITGRGRARTYLLATIILTAGCSGQGEVPQPSSSTPPVVDAKPAPKAGQPGSADYSGKGVGASAGQGR